MNIKTSRLAVVSVGCFLIAAAVTAQAEPHGGHWHGAPGVHGGFRGPPLHAPAAPFPGGRFHGSVRVPPHAPVYPSHFSSHFTGRYVDRAPHYGYHRGYVYPRAWHRDYYWHGGYWRGAYWPRAYYYSGCPLFLAALPLWYGTYWYSGVPYYYVNNVYYVRNDDDDGYVLADPPPVAGGDANEQGVAGSGEVYAYPSSGQSEQQQATDKSECRAWAADHVGDQAADRNRIDSSDYRRAVMACLEGRGYTAK